MFSLFTRRKATILYVGGGMTFTNKKNYLSYLREKTVSLEQSVLWPAWLEENTRKQTFFIKTSMPCKENADYDAWKIIFEKYLSHVNQPLILVGWSLGGIFLARYLSENKLKKKAHAVYLIAPPYDDSLPGEELTNGFKLPKNLSSLEKNTKKLTLYFSSNDEVVPVSQARKYEEQLPKTTIKVLDVPGHFFIETFPELLLELRKDLRLIKR